MPSHLSDCASRNRTTALAVPALLVALALAGCSSDKHTQPIVKGPSLPPGTPGATAPDSTLLRWLTAYTVGVTGEVNAILTADFRYHFSAQTDPQLVYQYGNDWGKANEMLSLRHLLTGFTNARGQYEPAAGAMHFAVTGASVADDTSHADSTAWYKRVDVPTLALDISIPTSTGDVLYSIRSPLRLFFVRGDAAVLASGQTPDATRWYLRDCDDLSPLGPAVRSSSTGAVGYASKASTWGAVRSQYL